MTGTTSEPGAHARRVRRRRVFYIPGYDPVHPRRYRELYRTEGAAQAAASGYRLVLRAARPDGARRYGWHVEAEFGTPPDDVRCGEAAPVARSDPEESVTVAADVEVLVWSDLVRASMDRTIADAYLQLFRTAWIYIASGALRRLMWLRKGPVLAALYPVAMLLVQLATALVAGWLVASLVLRLAGGLLSGWPAAALWWGVLALVAVLVLRWWKRHDNRFFAYYLMHDYAYTAQLRGANPPALEARMAEFGARIAAALADDVDEVLVVGHSSGAHLAVSILADLIRAGRAPAGGPALGFLSLGQVIPMVSFLPEARRLRADLHYLSTREEVFWLDVTAPGDGCAFALCDPVAVSGVAPEGQRWPLVISAAFTQTLSPARWKALRWRFFRLHFQYLCAFDNLPGNEWDYDYFRVTAGPLTLGDRFRDRAPSASRIEVAASRYTSRAEGGADALPAGSA